MDLSKLSDGDLLALKSGNLAAVSDKGLGHLKSGAMPAQSSGAVVDSANAVGTGYFRGMTRLAGLPVDTVANVVDLGKAAIGAPYIAITGKAPPSWLEPTDRSRVLGSGENLLRGVRAVGAKGMVDPSNPEYEGGYLQAVGGATGGMLGAGSVAAAAKQAAMLGGSTVASKAVGDATGSNALAITAGMLPFGAQQYGPAAAKAAVRGGEAGRQEMARRVADLKAAGVDNPTLGLASGNKLIGGMENILQSTPGAVGIMQRNRDTAVSGLQAQTGIAADLASTNRGAIESGRSIQKGAADFKTDFKARQTVLYDRLDKFIGKQAPVEVAGTQGALAALNADIPTMPQLSKQFKNARIMAIEDALKTDLSGTKAKPGSTQAVIVDGVPMLQESPITPKVDARSAAPFEAVKKLRTLVGSEIADNSMMSDVPRSKWNPLYGAISDDIRGAAEATGPQATKAFNQANDYTRAGIGRMERIAPIIDRKAPEQSFTALAQTLKENTSTFQAVKKSLPPDARGDFAGTIIERLGKAKPGMQDETGAKWSPETFLTNWSNISPRARTELLSGIPNAPQVSALVESVAKATAMMRENSKMWANPSGTAANASARATLGTIGLGGAGAAAGMLSPMIPLSALAAVGGTNRLANALAGPTFGPKVRDAVLRKSEFNTGALNSMLLSQFAADRFGNQPGK